MPDSAVTLRSAVASQTMIATKSYARLSLSPQLLSKQNYLHLPPLSIWFRNAIICERRPMSARETAELLLLVGRLVQAEGYDGELSPAQWMALRYFARANPFS